ncbi:MAG TPA: hypothetical protein VIC56_05050 [Gemmatimonadota bacterium]
MASRRQDPAVRVSGLRQELLTILALVAGAGCAPDGEPAGPDASPLPRLAAAFSWETATPESQGLLKVVF